jgi:hypothetical protein
MEGIEVESKGSNGKRRGNGRERKKKREGNGTENGKQKTEREQTGTCTYGRAWISS